MTYFLCNICLAFNYSNYSTMITGIVPRMLTFFLMLLLYRLHRLFASMLPSNYLSEDVACATHKQGSFVWRIFEAFSGVFCTTIIMHRLLQGTGMGCMFLLKPLLCCSFLTFGAASLAKCIIRVVQSGNRSKSWHISQPTCHRTIFYWF